MFPLGFVYVALQSSWYSRVFIGYLYAKCKSNLLPHLSIPY